MKIQVTIGGKDFTAWYSPGSFQVDYSLRGTTRGSLSLLMYPPPGSFEELGSIVEVTDGDNFNALLFRGILFRVKVSGVADWEGNPQKGTNLLCELVGFDSLTDRFTVATVFENIAVSEAVKKIIDDLTPLSLEGVTYTAESIPDSPELDMYRVNYNTARKTFDELADLFGWVWYIDADRVFWFHPRVARLAPYNFTPSGRGYNSIERDLSLDGYANRLYLRAGQAETDGKTIRLLLKDDESDYQIPFGIADKPVIRLYQGSSLERTIDPSRIGIRSVDDDELLNTTDPTEPEFLFFYKIGDDKIDKNRLYIIPGNWTDIEIDYIGLYPINSRADNPAQQDARKAAQEGGVPGENSTGIWEIVKDDRTIDGIFFAAQRAEGMLELIDQDRDKITIRTPEYGFSVAEVVTVEAEAVMANGAYFVERVLVRDRGALRSGAGTGPTGIETTLQLLTTGALVDFWDFWRRIEEAGRELVVRENEVLILLQKEAAFVTVADTPNASVGNTIDPYTNDPYSVMLCGGCTVNQMCRPLEEGP